MASHDVVQLYRLMSRLDELCGEAAEIREELTKLASQRTAWPESGSVAPTVRKSIFPADFLPTSAVDSGNT
jgi:hypothetical protein